MKRYKFTNFDIDMRVRSLDSIPEEVDDDTRRMMEGNRNRLILQIGAQYGLIRGDEKIVNFKLLGPKPFSISAFHNKFIEQIRTSFIVGSYYPALTGACALGERLLNHLVLALRDDYKNTSHYKKIYRKKSFDQWKIPIEALFDWGVISSDVTSDFLSLEKKRNFAIHFNPDVDFHDKDKALEAVQLVQGIVTKQFSNAGLSQWIFVASGEMYVKQEAESVPFVQKIVVPATTLVGPRHRVEGNSNGFSINDQEYENISITDEKYMALRKGYLDEKSIKNRAQDAK